MTKPLIEFEDAKDSPVLRYDIPEPSSYEGRVYIECKLPNEFFNEAADETSADYLRNFFETNRESIAEFLSTCSREEFEHLLCSYNLDKSLTALAPSIGQKAEPALAQIAAILKKDKKGVVKLEPKAQPLNALHGFSKDVALKGSGGFINDFLKKKKIVDTDSTDSLPLRYELFRERVEAALWDDKMLPVLYRTQSGRIRLRFTPEPQPKDAYPRLVLIETYKLTTFPGDFGAGITIQTFSLLPGEETTITVKTWQKSSQTTAEASSILDSYTEDKADEFEKGIQAENTSALKMQETSSYNIEASAHAGWGWGSADVKGGTSGSTSSSREQTTKNVVNATEKHASKASAKREVNVSSATTTTVESGQEEFVERRIKNVNVSRTLNFVFRQLNQEYHSVLHLTDLRIGFYNGFPGSMHEYALSDLDLLISDYMREKAEFQNGPLPVKCDPNIVQNNAIATRAFLVDMLLNEYGDAPGIRDFESTHKPLIELIETATPKTQTWRGKSSYLRVIPSGAIEQKDHSWVGRQAIIIRPAKTDGGGIELLPPVRRFVDGVIVAHRVITMRTAGVVVEALMGTANALDEYATKVQAAANTTRELENERLRKEISAAEKSKEPAVAFAQIFNPPQTSQLRGNGALSTG